MWYKNCISLRWYFATNIYWQLFLSFLLLVEYFCYYHSSNRPYCDDTNCKYELLLILEIKVYSYNSSWLDIPTLTVLFVGSNDARSLTDRSQVMFIHGQFWTNRHPAQMISGLRAGFCSCGLWTLISFRFSASGWFHWLLDCPPRSDWLIWLCVPMTLPFIRSIRLSVLCFLLPSLL